MYPQYMTDIWHIYICIYICIYMHRKFKLYDKGLGTVVLKASTYNGLANIIIICKSFSPVSHAYASQVCANNIVLLQQTVQFGLQKGVICHKVAEYLQCLCSNNSWEWPHMRLLIKVHKPSLGARPIILAQPLRDLACTIFAELRFATLDRRARHSRCCQHLE